MNAKTSKRLRREIYGDMSLRGERRYTVIAGGIANEPGSLRASYQRTKRAGLKTITMGGKS